MKTKLTYITGALIAVTMLIACSSTKLLSSWKSNIPANTTDKVLVFSLIGKSTEGIDYQDNFEDAVVNHLRRENVNAYSAYDVFGPNALKKSNQEELAKKIREDNYTGVMLLVFKDKDQSDEYVPPTTTTYAVPVGGPMYYDPWFHPYYSCYNYYYDQVTTPGYWTTTTTYILEARLYNATDENDAVYVATTATTDPSDPESAAKEFAQTILKDMKTKEIIK